MSDRFFGATRPGSVFQIDRAIKIGLALTRIAGHVLCILTTFIQHTTIR